MDARRSPGGSNSTTAHKSEKVQKRETEREALGMLYMKVPSSTSSGLWFPAKEQTNRLLISKSSFIGGDIWEPPVHQENSSKHCARNWKSNQRVSIDPTKLSANDTLFSPRVSAEPEKHYTALYKSTPPTLGPRDKHYRRIKPQDAIITCNNNVGENSFRLPHVILFQLGEGLRRIADWLTTVPGKLTSQLGDLQEQDCSRAF